MQLNILHDFKLWGFFLQCIEHTYSEELSNMVEINEILLGLCWHWPSWKKKRRMDSQAFVEQIFQEWRLRSWCFFHTSIWFINRFTKSVVLAIFISFQRSLYTEYFNFWGILSRDCVGYCVGYQLGCVHIAGFWKLPAAVWQYRSLCACAGEISRTWDEPLMIFKAK